MNLEGKTAIVTGGAKGIGKAISEKLASEGAKVIALGRTEASKIGDVSSNSDINKNIEYRQCDVSDFNSVSDFINNLRKEVESIDFLINNAGITRDNLILRMSEEEWDQVIEVNLKGVFNITKAVSRIMLSQKHGRIVNIGSIVGTTGNAGQSNYSAAKAGLIGFTKSLAKELASRNILVNLIAPGYVLTDMTEKLTEDQIKAFKDNIPLKRAAEPDDIANVVSFFVSEDSSYITGQVLHVDGGLAI